MGVYRLIAMHYRTPSFDYRGPGSLNSSGAKAAFYIFHILPEWLAVAILLCFNTRKIFGTALWGDWRGEDDTAEVVEKRKAQKIRRAARKEARMKALKRVGKSFRLV